MDVEREIAGSEDDLDGEFMREMRALYLAGSERRLRQLRDAVAALREFPRDSETLYEAYRLSHSLRGGAGSHGFLTAMEIGRRMEWVLHRALQGDIPVDEGVLGFLEECIETLAAYYARADEGEEEPSVDLSHLTGPR
jgi:two-component system chemotaxis sensor kinase CheA